jgi:hypothetical protein
MLMRLGKEKGMVLATWKRYILCFYHKFISNKSNFIARYVEQLLSFVGKEQMAGPASRGGRPGALAEAGHVETTWAHKASTKKKGNVTSTFP